MEACMRTVRRASRRLGAASERFQGFQGEFELGETELSGPNPRVGGAYKSFQFESIET